MNFDYIVLFMIDYNIYIYRNAQPRHYSYYLSTITANQHASGTERLDLSDAARSRRHSFTARHSIDVQSTIYL
eukprot:COSAG05_NODE_3_length_51333_cov_129.132080_35_plen_73_part_00